MIILMQPHLQLHAVHVHVCGTFNENKIKSQEAMPGLQEVAWMLWSLQCINIVHIFHVHAYDSCLAFSCSYN